MHVPHIGEKKKQIKYYYYVYRISKNVRCMCGVSTHYNTSRHILEMESKYITYTLVSYKTIKIKRKP